MSDIVERLRDRERFVSEGPRYLMAQCGNAADEIERLRLQVVTLQMHSEARELLKGRPAKFARHWQDIASAPKDGTRVLGFWSYIYEGDAGPTTGIEIVEWDDDWAGWADEDGVSQGDVYKFWMPLPAPPTQE